MITTPRLKSCTLTTTTTSPCQGQHLGGAFVIFLSMSHMCSRVPGWQAEVAGSCSWWLLAQPEARRTGRLGGSLALGFLAHHFLSQRHDEGGQGGWMLVGFKLNGCHSCWAPTGKALAACLRRILLPCFMCIHIYIQISDKHFV